MKYVYLIFCFLGLVVPHSQLLPFLQEYGFNLRIIFGQLSSYYISSYLALEIILTNMVLLIFILADGIRKKIPGFWLAALSLPLGVAVALPFYLFLLERRYLNTKH